MKSILAALVIILSVVSAHASDGVELASPFARQASAKHFSFNKIVVHLATTTKYRWEKHYTNEFISFEDGYNYHNVQVPYEQVNGNEIITLSSTEHSFSLTLTINPATSEIIGPAILAYNDGRNVNRKDINVDLFNLLARDPRNSFVAHAGLLMDLFRSISTTNPLRTTIELADPARATSETAVRSASLAVINKELVAKIGETRVYHTEPLICADLF